MARNRYHRLEFPSGLGYSRDGASLRETGLMFEQPATDAYVAMMAAAPYEEIEIEPEPYGATFELAEEILTEEEFAVIQMLFGGRLSQRETGLLLARQKGRATAYSKTWVRKLRNRALQKMRKYGTVGDTPQKNLGDR